MLNVVVDAKTPSRKFSPGLLRRLSSACRKFVRTTFKQTPCGVVYDNINFSFNVAEQILGRTGTFENGTCATVIPLFDALLDDMKTCDYLKSYDEAPPLEVEDILLTADENAQYRHNLQGTVLRILVNQAPEHFGRFKSDVEKHHPPTSESITLHKTDIYPLPAMNIDESSTAGNADVMEAIMKEVKYDKSAEYVQVVFGDQLSVAQKRSVANTRAGHDSLFESQLRDVAAPGFFHYQSASSGAVLITHWGDPSGWVDDPSSLHFHNTLLNRKPITLTSPPPYRTSRDLIFVSLYARIFYCLKLVSSYTTLKEYAATVTFDQLCTHTAQIINNFTESKVVIDLRQKREETGRIPESESPHKNRRFYDGDMVFENAVLFMRDALILREFTDAIKAGDSGRLIVVLKTYALLLRGAGRTKYAHEILHLVHNLKYVWPKGLRYVQYSLMGQLFS